MARATNPPPDTAGERIVDIDVQTEMQGAFLEYAYSVIYSRALPDARDGLKPVQRRILYSMAEMGLRPDRAHVKCGRIVGDVMGKLHPHGDSAIYDALVRLAQDFTMRLPLIDGHGNFGSLDDGPAAYRYCVTGETRIRLADGSSPRIGDLAARHGLEANSEADVALQVLDRHGRPVRADRIFHSGTHPVIAVSTETGHELQGSHNHPVLTLREVDRVPRLVWRRLDQLQPGDVLCLARHAAHPSSGPTERTDPVAVDGQAAYVAGGGAEGLVEGIPDAVWCATPATKRAFLSAAFQSDGSVVRGRRHTVSVRYRTPHRRLARDLAQVLLEFGVVAQLTQDVHRGAYRVLIAGRHNVAEFAASVSFLGSSQARLHRALDQIPQTAHRMSADAAPFLADYLVRALPTPRPDTSWVPADTLDGWPDRRAGVMATLDRTSVREVVAQILDPGYRYVHVASVEPRAPEPVYSVRVATEDHSFLAGGFVNHNTEARMASPAALMTDGLDENVIDFVPNYDGQLMQPDVLPSAFPNLLVNGASGIAVGMATNMPPHNLIEVIGAARHLLTHPEASLDDLMRFVPGPDLPTGGKIVGLDGIRDAYATGRGTFRTRATTRVEAITPRRQGIVVTELPYLVGPEKVLEKIKDLVQAKRLHGIANVVDLTDREQGLRLVIELKGGFNADAVLEHLFRMTPMEDSFGINNVALVEGQPRTLGLREMLEVYIGHRLEVVRRRCEHRLGKAADRLHLVEGLLIAILDIDEVIAVIRSSDDTAQARTRLMEIFDLSRVQADYILEMPLRRLTKFSKLELDKEKIELETTMAELRAILADEGRRREVVSTELADVASAYGTPRRTVLLESAGAAVTASRATPLEIADDPCWVLMSSTGLLARTASDEALSPADPARRAAHDAVVSKVAGTARGEVAALTTHGRMVRLGVVDMPSLPPTSSAPSLSGGVRIEEFLALEKGERVLALTSLRTDGPGIAVGTAQGVVKRVLADYPGNKDSWEIIALRDGDQVIGAVELPSENSDLVFVSSDAQLLRFGADKVRPQGRAAGGMAGIALSRGARAIFFGAVDLTLDDGEWASVVVTVAGSGYGLPGTQTGSAKVTPFAEYPAKGRATGGVRCQRFLKGEDTLLLAWAGTAPPLAAGANGVAVPLPPPDSRRDGSGTPLRQPVAAVTSPA